jgi:hypothetical protein
MFGRIKYHISLFARLVFIVAAFLLSYCSCNVHTTTLFSVEPGKFTNDDLKALLTDPVLKNSAFAPSWRWLHNKATFFSFQSRYDSLTIQALAINEKGQRNKAPIVFCSGFGETFLKYGEILRSLVLLGHPVYSYDLRGM